MFESGSKPDQKTFLTRVASLAAHAVLFAWLISGSRPLVLTPTSLKRGENNGSVVLYLPDALAGGRSEATQSADVQQMSAKALLNWRPPQKVKSRHHGEAILESKADSEQNSQQVNSLPPVGSPFGSQSDGSLVGTDVRPALPIVSSEPRISSDDLGNGTEGDVVVEITIDEKGNIVQKTVVRSLTPVVDNKVLAALEGWRFTPATRNGMPIASKQDVYYHFRPN